MAHLRVQILESLLAPASLRDGHDLDPLYAHGRLMNTTEPTSSFYNSGQKVVIPEIAELESFDDEVCIEEDRQSDSKGHLSPRHNILQVSGRVHDTPVAWNVNFTGGPDIGGNASPNVSGKRRRLSELDSVVSVYDMGLLDSQEHHLSQNEAAPKEINSSLSADQIEDTIRDMIEGKLCWSKMDQKEYLPRSAFEEIFTIATVQSLIRAIYPHAADGEVVRKFDQIIGDTRKSRRMIIATLVFMKQTGHIEDFIREEIYDCDMPLRHERKSMREFRTRAGPIDKDERINTTLFQEWERVHVDLFYIYQKMIFVPIFKMDDGKLRSYVLDRDVRLPWAKFEHKTSGGHGIVHKLQIHPSHYNLEGNNRAEHPRCFAVKEIHAADHESYRNELRALEKACARVQKEKHLIKLLLTFQHGDKPYLVFEWADGNLQEFWARNKVASVDASTRWMLRQCRGIANAVKRIHGLATWQKQGRSTGSGAEDEEDLVKDWGRHGDIKPSNILWFSTYGEDSDHLVVADLGLTRYHSRLTRSRVLRVDGFTGTYRAPEIDLGDPISSKYDIWSLGCVFLEFCIWYLLGAEAIETFESERRNHPRLKEMREQGEFENSYFMTDVSTGRKEAVLNPAVAKCISKLEALESCTPFARQMLRLVTTQMLVINPKQRSSIDVISSELSNIGDSLPGFSGGQARGSGTTDTSVPRETSVRFAEENSIIPRGNTTTRHRGRTFSVTESDDRSSDGSSNAQSTAVTSVVGSEQDERLMQ